MATEYPFEGTSPRRVLALQDYAVIGDGRSVALIGLDGSAGWWCVPKLDSEPLFGSLLDAKGGGFFTLQPAGAFSAKRVYPKDSKRHGNPSLAHQPDLSDKLEAAISNFGNAKVSSRSLDFSSLHALVTTLLSLAVITLLGVGIRLLTQVTIQQRRER